MSDFSELCPLFNTGVFNEVTFNDIPMSAVSICANALSGTIRAAHQGYFTFGRTVVVTGAFVRRLVANSVEAALLLQRRASGEAVGTTFGSLTIPVSVSSHEIPYTWAPFTLSVEKTFTSSDVLGFTLATAIAGSAGVYDLMVRYREK